MKKQPHPCCNMQSARRMRNKMQHRVRNLLPRFCHHYVALFGLLGSKRNMFCITISNWILMFPSPNWIGHGAAYGPSSFAQWPCQLCEGLHEVSSDQTCGGGTAWNSKVSMTVLRPSETLTPAQTRTHFHLAPGMSTDALKNWTGADGVDICCAESGRESVLKASKIPGRGSTFLGTADNGNLSRDSSHGFGLPCSEGLITVAWHRNMSAPLDRTPLCLTSISPWKTIRLKNFSSHVITQSKRAQDGQGRTN